MHCAPECAIFKRRILLLNESDIFLIHHFYQWKSHFGSKFPVKMNINGRSIDVINTVTRARRKSPSIYSFEMCFNWIERTARTSIHHRFAFCVVRATDENQFVDRPISTIKVIDFELAFARTVRLWVTKWIESRSKRFLFSLFNWHENISFHIVLGCWVVDSMKDW